jgi:hypothetical protein|nr:thioredoxin family protein [uncultured Capnocytophaga sp.]
MKMRRLLLLTLIIALIGCKKQPTNSTFFTGFFPNSKDSLVILYANDIPIDTTFLNKSKVFTFSLNIKESRLYNFKIGGKYQYVYLEPLDSLVVYANTLRFEESISFSGKGSTINNFLLSQLNCIDSQSDILKKYHSLPLIKYREKIDSILMIKEGEFNHFIKNNPYLTKKAQNIAWVSCVFPIYKEFEIYPFIYHDKNEIIINHLLPSDFYNYRKQINYNDTFLEYYRPYYSYIVMYVNNLAFTKYTHNNSTLVDVNRELGFHLEKIKIIDSLFDKGSLRDNLYRNAAYAYIFNIQEHAQYQDYFDKFAKYNKDNEHKAELDKVFKNVIALQAGQTPPDFDLIDTKGTLTKFSEIQKPEVTIYYFWSVNQRELSNLIFNRITQLKSLFPNVKFVGIDIGQDKTQWHKKISESQWTDQYHSINFMDLSQKFLINNINKSVIIDKNGRIISAFEDIFSPNLEKILLYKAS